MLTLGLNECFGAGMRQPFVRFRQLAEQYRRIRLRVAVRTGPASAQSASNSSFVMTCLSSPYVALPTRRVRQNSLAPNSGVNSAVTCSADRSVTGHRWAIASLLRAVREDDRVLVTSLLIYPVKSLGGVGVDTAGIEPWGIAGDRRWGLIDDSGQKITAREVHRLLRFRAEVIGEHTLSLIHI